LDPDDATWKQEAKEAERLFERGWIEEQQRGQEPDVTGIYSVERTEAHYERRHGDYQKADATYRRFLEYWTNSKDPLHVANPDPVSCDYLLTAAWLAECLLRQADAGKQQEGRLWAARIDHDAEQVRVQHMGFMARRALVHAAVLWRDGRRDEAVGWLDNALADPMIQEHAGDRSDLEQLRQEIRQHP
jgi:tetratricopeptide (TPR) repeat protein